jgi:hypothetical protein
MADGVDQYLDHVQKQRSLRTYRTYRLTLKNLFLNSFTKAYVDEVNRATCSATQAIASIVD